MCIYIHPYLSLPKQREVTGVVHIGVGFLRCSFPIIGIAKALKHGTDEGEIPTPLLYILAGITIIRSSNGNPGDAHLQNDMIHAGQLIERTLHEQGRTVTWFASQLCCTRPVYPNRIQFRILLGTMFSPAGIVLSHTFASILTYNHKGI